jgi:hypothetical protein
VPDPPEAAAALPPDADQGYLDWLSERAALEELVDLKDWPRQTLVCAPLPCTCLQTLRCLRCRVAAIVQSEGGA